MPSPLIQSTGRRKESVARVRLRPGNGTVTVNGRTAEDYFPSESHRLVFTEPLRVTATITDTREAQARFDLVLAQEIAAENDLRVKKIALERSRLFLLLKSKHGNNAFSCSISHIVV